MAPGRLCMHISCQSVHSPLSRERREACSACAGLGGAGVMASQGGERLAKAYGRHGSTPQRRVVRWHSYGGGGAGHGVSYIPK